MTAFYIVLAFGIAYTFTTIYPNFFRNFKWFRKLKGGIWFYYYTEHKVVGKHGYYEHVKDYHWTRKKPNYKHIITVEKYK